MDSLPKLRRLGSFRDNFCDLGPARGVPESSRHEGLGAAFGGSFSENLSKSFTFTQIRASRNSAAELRWKWRNSEAELRRKWSGNRCQNLPSTRAGGQDDVSSQANSLKQAYADTCTHIDDVEVPLEEG